MSEDKNMISDEAVEAAAQAIHEAAELDVPWTGSDWRADCARNEARAALEAAAPHILQSAAHDLAGADKTSHWDDRYREFEEQDGGDLSSDSSAYLDGIGDAMRFLQDRATNKPAQEPGVNIPDEAVIPDEAAHAVDPGWSALYDGFRCRKCGKWAYKTSAGEWKHGGEE